MYIAYLVASLSHSKKEHKMLDKVQEPGNPESSELPCETEIV
jgi:hypothetical protein